VELEEVKPFLRIDGDEEDNVISPLILAAEAYIKIATRPDVDTSNELYKIAVKLLISHWYENREAVVVGSISKSLEFSLQSILIQLSHCGSPGT
jgi:uncharacterized phage protein (predicted DNA packaging)